MVPLDHIVNLCDALDSAVPFKKFEADGSDSAMIIRCLLFLLDFGFDMLSANLAADAADEAH